MPGMTHGAWCHIEIPAANTESSKQFYGGLLGWTFTEVPEMKYTIYSTGEGEIGGGFFTPPEGTPRMITNYVTVKDLEAAALKVPQLGGKVVGDRMEVPGMGWFRIVTDPDGNSIGLWQAAQPPKSKDEKPRKASAAKVKKAVKKKAPAKKAKKKSRR
jgi:uncharacterized protein